MSIFKYLTFSQVFFMALRQLKSLCLIAKHGSVKEAGKRSFSTSSAVSLQIKMLERELGIKLFEHVGKTIGAHAARGQREVSLHVHREIFPPSRRRADLPAAKNSFQRREKAHRTLADDASGLAAFLSVNESGQARNSKWARKPNSFSAFAVS
jgi:hypothetical protein